MRIKIFLILLLSCWAGQVSAADPMDVSLIQLIANGKDYDGKLVRVAGVVNFEVEGDAIYTHKEDIRYSLTKNGLWLDVGDVKKSKYNGKYVLVEGTFSASSKGHLSLWSGSLRNVSRIVILPDRQDPETIQR